MKVLNLGCNPLPTSGSEYFDLHDVVLAGEAKVFNIISFWTEEKYSALDQSVLERTWTR